MQIHLQRVTASFWKIKPKFSAFSLEFKLVQIYKTARFSHLTCNHLTFNFDHGHHSGAPPQVQWIQSGYINEQYDNKLVSDSMSRIKTFKTKLRVQYQGQSQYGLSEIAISVDVDRAFICSTPMIRIESMNQNQNIKEFELIFYVQSTAIVLNRECRLCAVYLNEDDRMQCNQISFQFPFGFALNAVPPIKNTKYSFTLEVSNSLNVPMPTELFSDLIDDQHRGEIMRTPQALTMVFDCNQHHDVTLLLSRKGGRIRIQTGALEAVRSILL